MPLVKPKKNLGQHFLRNEDIARQIAESIVSSPENVLEIGPGMGVLTKYLIEQNYENFNVVEIDRESVEYLQQHYPALREHIWSKDFLTLDLASLFEPNLTIIGNFPYNISSQILFKVLDYKNLVNEVVGMFQKEVAERVAAKPGNRQYGILSVLLQAFYDIEYLFTVDEHQFFPPPKVKSAVIRLTRNPDKQLHCAESLFKQVVKSAFNQRRKTLRNSLNHYDFPDQYRQNPIFGKRPEQLNVQEFEQICLNVIA